MQRDRRQSGLERVIPIQNRLAQDLKPENIVEGGLCSTIGA